MGSWTKAEAYASVVLGQFNVGGGDPDSWVNTDPLLEIGVGSSSADSANALTVLKNGNVGLGTHLPVTSFHLKKGIGSGDPTSALVDAFIEDDWAYLELSGSAFAGVTFKDNGSSIYSGLIYDYSNHALQHVTNGLARMTILNNGNVGIGTNSPDAKLHVEGTIEVDQRIKANDIGGLEFATDDATIRLKIADNGNVGIGTETPGYRLEVVGNTRVDDLITNNLNGVINVGGAVNALANVIGDIASPVLTHATGDEDLYIEDDLEVVGQGYKTGGGAWASISDRRLKKNIVPFTDGLQHIIQIAPVSFQYNGLMNPGWDNGKTYVGIVAQDIQRIAPYMVEESFLGRQTLEQSNGSECVIKSGTPYLTYDATALTYILVNAVKDLADQNDQLIDHLGGQHEVIATQQEKIGVLETENIELRDLLMDLTARVKALENGQ